MLDDRTWLVEKQSDCRLDWASLTNVEGQASSKGWPIEALVVIVLHNGYQHCSAQGARVQHAALHSRQLRAFDDIAWDMEAYDDRATESMALQALLY